MDNSHTEDGESTPEQRHSRAKSNCQGCYQRKTKCDRRLDGCTNCAKLSMACTYQSHKSQVSQKRGPYNKDLLRKNLELEQKVATLEATVQTLRRQVPDGSVTLPVEPQRQVENSHSPPSLQNRPRFREHINGGSSNGGSAAGKSADDFTLLCISWDNFVAKFSDNKNGPERRQDHDPQDTPMDPISDATYRSKLHPNAQKLLEYWSIFKARINPLLKIVHIQTAENCLFDGKRTPDDFNICSDALRLSIYHAALTVSKDSGSNSESRESDLRKYSRAIKLILEEPDVLASPDLLALQALTIYLYHNQNDDEHVRYVLIGKALRMAQSLGLHRDGIILQKSPFETEMRRRIWWNIHRLESRLAENYLINPFCGEPQFDTLLPTNINDCDMSPVDGEFPKPRDGLTEMSFCLVDFELSSLTFKLLRLRPPIGSEQQEQKSRFIQESLKSLTDKQLKFCKSVNDFDCMITSHAKISLSRIWLLANQPSKYCFDRMFKHPNVTAVTLKGVPVRTLLPTALETFEYGLALLSEPRVSRWSWIWGEPNQILVHLRFYLFQEICCRPCHPMAQRAWRFLDEHGCKEYCNDVAKTSPKSLDAMFDMLYSAAKRLRVQEAIPSAESDKALLTSLHTSQNITTAQPFDYNPINHLVAQGARTQDSSTTRGFNGPLLGSTAVGQPEAMVSRSQGSMRLEETSADSGSLGFLSQSISNQDSAWLQFRDENMGVEEYSDGMWEALLTDLPTMA